MAKQIFTGVEGRTKLLAGINAGADIAAVTIGPRGRNVMSDRGVMLANITNDGLTSIQDLIMKDRVENMGLDILKDVARKTSEKARGARTASILLFRAIYAEGMKHLEEGVNVIALKDGIQQAAKEVISELKKMAIPVTTNEEIRAVATISSESEEIGKIVADTIAQIGNDGVITVEESPTTMDISTEIINGMKIDKGWIDSYMVNDYDKMEAVYSDVSVIVTDEKLMMLSQIQDILKKLGEAGKGEILLIAEEVGGEALHTCILNKLRGGFKIVAVRAPTGFGANKKETLQDICTLTGATLLGDGGMSLKSASLKHIGFAKKIVASKSQTIIMGAPSEKEAVEKRIASLKLQRATLNSKVEITEMENRIARLSGSAAIIKIGTATDSGKDYLKKKIEDAVSEAKAAIEEGIVAGGGSALAKIAYNTIPKLPSSIEDTLGLNIIQKAIQAPILQIMKNAGRIDGDENLKVIIDASLGNPNNGYDALNDLIIEDMIKSGICDPVKVLRIALENAAEAASTLLSVECIVADEPINNNNK